MARQAWIRLLFAAALALPSLVQCEYPWPDKVTQHKGYIEVLLKGPVIAIMCAHLQPALQRCRFMFTACWKLVHRCDIHCNYEVCSD